MRLSLIILLCVGSAAPADSVSDALAYLCREMDVFHNRCVIVDDLESGGERFLPSGWMRGAGAGQLEWDQDAARRLRIDYVDQARSGATALRLRWKPAQPDEWVAISFQNIEDNFDKFPGLDLTGATKLTGWVRGSGRVTFRCGSADADLELGAQWQPLELDLSKDPAARKDVKMGLVVEVTSAIPANRNGVEIVLDDVSIDHQRLAEPRLLRSYQLGARALADAPQLRNACFVYDNALVISAFLASADPKHQARAVLIADALVLLAAAEKQSGGEARLRNAYAAGDVFGRYRANGYKLQPRLPGWLNRGNNPAPDNVPWFTDAYSQGTDAGNMAWACLALLNCQAATKKEAHLRTACELADWVLRHCSKPRLGFGFTGGVKWNPQTEKEEDVGWQSTEHNIDLVSVFRRLAQLDSTNRAKWNAGRQSAEKFVTWALEQGKDDGPRLITGTLPDRGEAALTPKPLDPQAWAILSLPERAQQFAPALNWLWRDGGESCFVRVDGLWGFGFSTQSRNIWPEGTAQVALAELALGRAGRWREINAQLEKIQQWHAKRIAAEAGAMPAAYPKLVETGYENILYRDFAHCGAGAWYVMSALRYTPFTGQTLAE